MRSQSLIERILSSRDDVADHLVITPGRLDDKPLSSPAPLRRELIRVEPVESAPELDRLSTHRRAAQSELPLGLDSLGYLRKGILGFRQSGLVELVDSERVVLNLREVTAPDHVRSCYEPERLAIGKTPIYNPLRFSLLSETQVSREGDYGMTSPPFDLHAPNAIQRRLRRDDKVR